MRFLDRRTLLEAIQNEVQSSQLTFQIVDESVLSFSMQLPHYLNTPQVNQMTSIKSDELDLLSNILLD